MLREREEENTMTEEQPLQKKQKSSTMNENNQNESGSTRNEGLDKKKKKKTSRGKNKQKKNTTSSSSDANNDRQEWISEKDKKNEIFEKYYKLQKIIKPEEWEQFMDTVRQQLPITFRINPSDEDVAQKIKNKIQKEYIPMFKEQQRIQLEEIEKSKDNNKEEKGEDKQAFSMLEPFEIPQEIAFYPGEGMAWKLTISKALFRKHAVLKEFRQFIMDQTEQGGISRQEAVSMLPPLFFDDFKPSDKVLDMCAAPGSKTAQLMERLFNSTKNPNEISGLVVANDNDVKRCYLLTHQLQRLSAMLPHVIVTNHDATQYPSLIKFDKILCDVMCSGDGTLRKSPDLWKRWGPGFAWSLHAMQIRVAMCAYRLLKPGGMIVYSTCSLNPIEDEAVVCEIIRQSKGNLQLVDSSQKLKSLLYGKGLNTWAVTDYNANPIESFDKVPPNLKEKISKSMFPPTEEEAKAFNLHYCMRLLPHLQDTGGFFVAVFKKNSNVEEKDDTITADGQDVQPKKEKIRKFKGKGVLAGEIITTPDKSITSTIMSFYGIDENKFSEDQFLFRTTVKSAQHQAKKMYLVSPAVRDIIQQNDEKKKWIIVNLGIRAFEHNTAGTADCSYRITQEGVELALANNFFKPNSERIISMPKDIFIATLNNEHTLPDNIQHEEAKSRVKKIPTGGCIVVCTEKPQVGFAAYRTEFSLLRYVKQEEVPHILQRLV